MCYAIPFPSRSARPLTAVQGPRVLSVKLAGPAGERWAAVGVGGTVDEALQWALESAPDGTPWLVGGWNDLYGD